MDNTLKLRPVATSNLNDALNNSNLAAQWPLYKIPKNRIAYQLYYYLISISAYDHVSHSAYVSDRYIVKKDIAEKLKCDPRSISNNFKTLEKSNIIRHDDKRHGWIFLDNMFYASISYDIIREILDLDGLLDAVEALRILSIIAYAFFHDIRKFSVTDIKYALGRPQANGEFIRICLSWWKSIGLIDYSESIVNRGYCNYILYTLNFVNTRQDLPHFEDGPLSAEYQQLFANSLI